MTTHTAASVYMQMDALDWFLMALGLLVFAALLLWLGTSLAGERRTAGEVPSEETAALHLLDRRVARGEITVEEHNEVHRILASEHPPSSDKESEKNDVLA